MRKKITLLLGVLLVVIAIPINVFANSNEFSNLTMEIVIDEDATATITEIWEVSIYDGTEMYKPYYNMETSEIKNFSVTDETGIEYEYLSNWDINASQTDKKEKCGINKDIENEVIELCWGIGEYGTHTYTITYQITNFVSYYSSEEMQETYFTLVPNNMDPEPQNVEITISANFEFNENNITVKTEGFFGNTVIEDGKIKILTSSAMTSSQYINLLVKYNDEPFNVEDTVSSNEYGQANGEQSSFWSKYGTYIIIAIIIIIIVIVFINRNKNKRNNDYYIN